jgi:enamine deaminase RidA (YjgF/YER057c/UK114 family)
MVQKTLPRRSGETPELHAVGAYAQGYRAGSFVFLQGQTGLPLDTGEVVARGDPAGQTRQAMESIRELMRLAVADFSDVVKGLALDEFVVEIDAYGVIDD